MRLIKAEHNEKGIWYFFFFLRCAEYIGAGDPNVNTSLNTPHRPLKGWNLEWIEAYDIICKYIDPE